MFLRWTEIADTHSFNGSINGNRIASALKMPALAPVPFLSFFLLNKRKGRVFGMELALEEFA